MWQWLRYVLVPELNQILSILKEILATQVALLKGQTTMSKELDDLTAAVTKQTTVVGSAVTLIQSLAQQIIDAKNDPVAIEALAGQLNSSADALAAAVTANTPSA